MAIDYSGTGSYMPVGSAAQPAEQGFKWGDLTKMLGSKPVKNWLSSPANQRMIAEFGQALSMRNGKQGTGSMMAGAASNMINREEVGKTAAMQAKRKQLYNQQLMQIYKQMMSGGQQAGTQQQAVAPLSILRGDDWGAGFNPEDIGG